MLAVAVALAAMGYLSAQTEDISETSFKEVTAKLNQNGTMYFYLSPDSFLNGVVREYGAVKEIVLKDANLTPEDRKKAVEWFNFVGIACNNSGLGSIDGIGFSSIQTGKELYQGKYYIHRKPGTDFGLIWHVFDYKPQKFWMLEALPLDTVYAYSCYFYPKILWKWLNEQAAKSKAENIALQLKKLEKSFLEDGIVFDDFIDALGGEFGYILTADKEKKTLLPIPGKPLEIEQLDLCMFFTVKNDAVLNGLKKLIKGFQPVPGDSGLINLPVPPLFPHLKPVIAQRDGKLFIATNLEMVDKITKAAQAQEPDLCGSAEFKRLAANVPLEGNSLEFMSKRLVQVLTGIGRKAIGTEVGRKLMDEAEKSFAFDYFGVIQVTDSGYFCTFNVTLDPAAILIFKSIVVPAGFNASMVIPSIINARNASRQVASTDNLQSIGVALKIYAMNNQDKFPAAADGAGLAELLSKGFIKDGNILRAPDGRKYRYMCGFVENSDKNIPLVFDNPHLSKKTINVLFVDGRIESFPVKIGNCAQLMEFLNGKYKYSNEVYDQLMKEAAKLDAPQK